MLLVLWGFSTLTCGNSNYFWHCLSPVDFSTCFFQVILGQFLHLHVLIVTHLRTQGGTYTDLWRALYSSLLCHFLPCVCSSCLGLPKFQAPSFWLWETALWLHSFASAFTWKLTPNSKLGAIIGITSCIFALSGITALYCLLSSV